MKTRAKFTCLSCINNEETNQTNWNFSAVYHNDDKDHENFKFTEATPSGTLTMSVDNDVYHGAHPEQGKEYYLDITEAPAE